MYACYSDTPEHLHKGTENPLSTCEFWWWYTQMEGCSRSFEQIFCTICWCCMAYNSIQEGLPSIQSEMVPTSSNIVLLCANSCRNPRPAAVLLVAGSVNMALVRLSRSPTISSNMKVKLMPAAAKGYSHSERFPWDLSKRALNRSGSSCLASKQVS